MDALSRYPAGQGLPDPTLKPLGQREQAVTLHRSGHIDHAVEFYKAYLQDHPRDTGIWSNLGACLRSAEAAGVTAVVVPKRRSAPINSLARRTAAGAAESLFIAGVTNLVRTIEELQALGIWVYATSDAANSDYLNADLKGPCGLVLGSEERGVRRLVAERCDGSLSLPMHGAVESLNVSVATGVLLY